MAVVVVKWVVIKCANARPPNALTLTVPAFGFPNTAVNLAFLTREIRTLCESQTEAEREFGIEVARKLRACLADMRETENVEELLIVQPSAKVDGVVGRFEIHLNDGYKVVLFANHNSLPMIDKTGRIDWTRVRRLRIEAIERNEVANG